MFGHKKNESHTHTGDNVTLIGETCTVEGNINAQTYIKIDGKVLGHLNIDGSVVLGETGYIKGNITSGEVVVYGHIDGDVHADTLQLKNTATISGNIQAKSLQIDPGAVYQGAVTMHAKQAAPSEQSA